VILASGSPQRAALLAALGARFEVVVPEVEERTEGDPRALVEANALAKARAIAAVADPGSLIVAGDTEVALDGRVLGQPEDERRAREYLDTLSGREHQVLGGLAVLSGGQERSGVEVSAVRFRDLDAALVDAYARSGEWHGRAGGYAVQGLGSALVAGVEGDLSNVIGLPVGLLWRLAPELFGSQA
jgi:septum formation protein